jgi:hypothetical protein
LPTMLAETIEERKRKINCKILQVHSGERNTHTPFLCEAMATILLATSTSLGACFPLIHLVVYPTRPFNGDHSLGSVEFPRHVFHVAWPGSVPKVFKKHWKRNRHDCHQLGLRFTRKNTPYPTAMLWVTPLRSRPTSKIKWHSALRG